MGLLKNIKKMFSKNIDCSDELEDKIFYYYSSKNREVVVGANIIVPEKYVAVFVCKNKVCDVVGKGKHAINGSNMPKTFDILKLGKANKKGKTKKRFLADIYFVCTDTKKALEFESYDNYVNKSEKLGKIKAGAVGEFDFSIVDAGDLLKYFLSDRVFLKEEMFLDLLGGLVGNYINRKLELCFDDFLYIITSPMEVNEKLNTVVDTEDYFEDYGFRISNVVFKSLNVSSTLKERIQNELTNQRKVPNKKAPQIEVPVLKEVKVEIPELKEEKPERICSKCGNKLNSDSVFCDKCGHRINNFN